MGLSRRRRADALDLRSELLRGEVSSRVGGEGEACGGEGGGGGEVNTGDGRL